MKVICFDRNIKLSCQTHGSNPKYISELTELKKSKDYMQPDKTYFCISYFSEHVHTICMELNLSGNSEIALFGTLDTLHTVFTKKLTDTLIKSYHQKTNPLNPTLINYSA